MPSVKDIRMNVQCSKLKNTPVREAHTTSSLATGLMSCLQTATDTTTAKSYIYAHPYLHLYLPAVIPLWRGSN